MTSALNVNSIDKESGSTLTLGTSGTTISIPSGATITNNGTANGFGVSNDSVNVCLSADQAMVKNAITKVQYDTEVYDPNGWWDSTTNYRFQPDQSGYYLVAVNFCWGNAATTYDATTGYVYKNGSEFMSHEGFLRPYYRNALNICCIAQLNGSSDYLEIYARHGSTGDPPLDAQAFNGSTATNNMASFVRLT